MQSGMRGTRKGWSAAALALLAIISMPARAAAQAEVVEYYATDAVGSIRVVFGPDGNVKARGDFLPFGESVGDSGALPPQRFTGQERDGELGLDNFNARRFQPRLGRMTSVDPAGIRLGNPQSWNRYAYVVNNPLRYVDPTGMAYSCSQVYTQDSFGHSYYGPMECFNDDRPEMPPPGFPDPFRGCHGMWCGPTGPGGGTGTGTPGGTGETEPPPTPPGPDPEPPPLPPVPPTPPEPESQPVPPPARRQYPRHCQGVGERATQSARLLVAFADEVGSSWLAYPASAVAGYVWQAGTENVSRQIANRIGAQTLGNVLSSRAAIATAGRVGVLAGLRVEIYKDAAVGGALAVGVGFGIAYEAVHEKVRCEALSAVGW